MPETWARLWIIPMYIYVLDWNREFVNVPTFGGSGAALRFPKTQSRTLVRVNPPLASVWLNSP